MKYDVFFDPEILLVGFLHKANLNLCQLKQAQTACTMMTVYLTRWCTADGLLDGVSDKTVHSLK